MHAAARHPDLITIQDVADGFGISKNHLMKVTHRLALAGYIETQRGRTGGFRLAKRPEDINIGAIVRLGEGNAPLVELQGAELARWLAEHPEAYAVIYLKDRQSLDAIPARHKQAYRGGAVVLVNAQAAAGLLATSR
jgi:Rrf2 family protein